MVGTRGEIGQTLRITRCHQQSWWRSWRSDICHWMPVFFLLLLVIYVICVSELSWARPWHMLWWCRCIFVGISWWAMSFHSYLRSVRRVALTSLCQCHRFWRSVWCYRLRKWTTVLPLLYRHLFSDKCPFTDIKDERAVNLGAKLWGVTWCTVHGLALCRTSTVCLTTRDNLKGTLTVIVQHTSDFLFYSAAN